VTAPWLIVADDLTGAADCGIAFARAGLETVVVWDAARAGDHTVVALDTESRFLAPAAATARQVAETAARWRPGTRVYKKIDSTLRGQPAAELVGQLDFLAARLGRAPMVVLAPAFPATGRTTEGGRILVAGRPLEETPLWARDHTYETAHLPSVLAGVGLGCETADLAAVRDGVAAMERRLRAARDRGVAAVVCDAVTVFDLGIVAAATLPLADEILWMGTGGLSGRLAEQLAPSGDAVAATLPGAAEPVVGDGRSVLVVVGSVAEASRRQADRLSAGDRVVRLEIAAEDLLAGPDGAAWNALGHRLAEAVAARRDVLVLIAAEDRPDLSRGVEYAGLLARWLAPVTADIGALVMTGGDTARSLLTGLGATGIVLCDEVEPGVPLGRTTGAARLPVISKAGAFGDEETLIRCLARLRPSERTPK
jgi:uncharacterized protein YgbK (DUF1537 family)